MKKIKDKFTRKDVSRQRKWQLRREAEGKCRTCAKPAVTRFQCLECAIKAREAQRTKKKMVRRNLRAYSYRLEYELEKNAATKPVVKERKKKK